MRVTFSKLAGRRYRVAIERAHGAPLEPRNGPGYDEWLPHDLVHFVVEERLGLRLGVFGQLAAGGSGIFAPAPADRRERDRRTDRRLAAAGRADMGRSEAAAGRCLVEWRRRAGLAPAAPIGDRPADLPEDPDDLPEHAVRRVVSRLDEVATVWRALPVGGSLTLGWPAAATVHPSRIRAGRGGVSGSRTARRRCREPR